MKNILDAYEQFLTDVGEPINSISGDDEFNKVEFIEFNKEMLINTYFDVAKQDHIIKGQFNKLGVIDRFIRTIKQYIQKYMLINDYLEWTKYLDKLIELYNDTSNQGIKDMTPNEVFDDYDYMFGLYKGQKKYNQDVNSTFELKSGDIVRAILGKGTFEKEKQKFSSELYTIVQQIGYKFSLQDEGGKLLKRKYRASELLKIDKVTNRLGDKKEKAEKVHKKKQKQRKH